MYEVGPATAYSYTRGANGANAAALAIDGVDDRADLAEVYMAMDGLLFQEAEMSSIFQLVAALLHLGNITFQRVGDNKSATNNPKSLALASRLLEIREAALSKGITVRVLQTRGQAPVDIPLTTAEAEAARDAVAKFVYARLFDWLVLRINYSIGVGDEASNMSIGILDIFGFEILETNSFEQLCINYTNERLQQHFNAHTFRDEETVYQQERIQFTSVHYIDNQPVLDLIEQRPVGILPLVDEELRVPKGSDATFLTKLAQAQAANRNFGKVLAKPNHFTITHYAGVVTYDVNGFLVKNKDRLSEELLDLLQTSNNAFLRELFPPDDAEGKDATKKISLGRKFQQQLDELMNTLNATEPHYIRKDVDTNNRSMLFEKKARRSIYTDGASSTSAAESDSCVEAAPTEAKRAEWQTTRNYSHWHPKQQHEQFGHVTRCKRQH